VGRPELGRDALVEIGEIRGQPPQRPHLTGAAIRREPG